ncbi:FAD binding domain-containing protein [Salinigranum marinum]|uniref:FAD binding domain-containing protein n=1 Tax=Salinigranum marinum TaxID=1515595 RepID=UPI002989F7A2|nr:FAD binding domain-containing protein [Salinigranum marinum]
MRPDEFDYVRADSVDHALELLADDPAAELLAGGHSFLPRLKRGHVDPDTVVDVGEIDALRGITGVDDGDAVRIGALTTYATVEATDGLRPEAPALVEAVGATADTQIRNRATVGGNLVAPYPVSDLSAAAVAGDVTLVFEGVDGERRVEAEAFLRVPHATVGATELLTRIEVPHATGAVGGAYVKRSSTTSRYTLLGVAVRLAVRDGTVSNAGVAVTGVTDHAVRLPSVEGALGGATLDGETIAAAAAQATADVDESTMKDDSEASAAFRADVLPVETERALERAAARADARPPA